MLVLTRMEGERIVIGEGPDAVYVSVERIEGGQVKIGVEAPRDVPVDREEVRDRIERRRSRA